MHNYKDLGVSATVERVIYITGVYHSMSYPAQSFRLVGQTESSISLCEYDLRPSVLTVNTKMMNILHEGRHV